MGVLNEKRCKTFSMSLYIGLITTYSTRHAHARNEPPTNESYQ